MNIRSRSIALVSIVAAAVFAAGANLGPAQASIMPLTASTPTGSAIGLTVQFKHGFKAVGARGQLVHQGVVEALGIPVQRQWPLGGGWRELRFAGVASEARVQLAMSVMSKQAGVVKVGVDRLIRPAGYKMPSPSRFRVAHATNIFTQLFSVIKPASAPLKVTTKDSFSVAKPTLTSVTTSWSKPKSLFGATLIGYSLQVSFDAGKTKQPVGGSFGAKVVKATLISGLQPGVPVWVRIAALTKLGKVTKVGTYSAWTTATPTGLPQDPQFVSLPINTTRATLSWDSLSLHESGGLPVTYTAKASATGHTDVLCVSTSTTCTFAGLVAGVDYAVQLKAANKWGSTNFIDPWPVADPYYKYEWQLSSPHGISVLGAWARTQGSQDVTVAVIDSGITPHPDLDGQQYHNQDGSVYGYDFVSSTTSSADGDGWDNNPTDETADNSWHGTHVSGIIAAAANDIGVVGVAPGVKLEEIRALGATGGSSSDLIPALLWAGGASIQDTQGNPVPVNIHPAKVVNLSLGELTDLGCDAGTQSAIQWLHDQKISVVTAGGNDSSPAINSYPGNCYPTINVGATGYTGTLAGYSNWGYGIDISAPGGDFANFGGADKAPDGQSGGIYSTINLGTTTVGQAGYGSLEGTSMAAPVVSGVVALLYSLKPNLTPDIVISILRSTATPWPAGSVCATQLAKLKTNAEDPTAKSCGVGIVNADAALKFAADNY